MKLQRQAGKKGIAFRLSTLSPTLAEHIRIDRLDQILAIDLDEAAALAALGNKDQKGASP